MLLHNHEERISCICSPPFRTRKHPRVEEERNSALQTLTSEACCLCHSNILPKPKLFPFISSLLSSSHLPSIQLLSSYPPYSTLISCVQWNRERTF
ncbi:hypothetical protein S83_010882 [Arachis hypogaea]